MQNFNENRKNDLNDTQAPFAQMNDEDESFKGEDEIHEKLSKFAETAPVGIKDGRE